MNLASIIETHPAGSVAIVSDGHDTTYGALREEVARCRGGLVSLGVEPGDRVGIACGNEPAFVVAYLGILGIGAVAVLLNPLAPAPELTGELVATGCSVLIAGPSAVPSVAGIARALVADLRDIVVVASPAGAPSAGGAPVGIPGAVAFDDLLSADPVPPVDRDPADLAALLFTSGTAGAPRAAMLSHGNLLANLHQIQVMPGRRQTPDDIVVGVIPLFHVFGLNVVLGTTLVVGARVVLVDRFDPAELLASVADNHVTILSGPPTMWDALVAHVDEHQAQGSAPDLSSLRLAVSGASKLGLGTAAAVHERFALHVEEGYGLTEASPVVTATTGTGAPVGSIGLPLPGVEVRVVDASGLDTVVGDVGELWVHGPNVFSGYWNDEPATAAALTTDAQTGDRWLRTGDLAVVDDAGFLFLVDRAKDLIIVSGFNVYPGEVEEALMEHPAVAAAAVIGVPDPRTGESIKAFVVLEAGVTIDADELMSWCATRVARYKAPTAIEFVDGLPQNLAGKLLRRALR